MRGLPNVGLAVERVLATAQNGLEVLRMGGLDTGTEPAPFQIAETTSMYRLRRYFPRDLADGPQVILIPPMMVSANVYDVTPDKGAVSVLHRNGIDCWVVDFGSPDKEVGGMARTLADHIVAIDEVIELVREATGKPVHLGGYSQGGMFAYQAAAYRRSKDIASVITFGSPVDVLAALPLGLPATIVAPGAQLLADNVFNRIAVPGWLARTGFQLLDPVKAAKSRIDFLLQLHDRDALLPREDQRRFLEADGWVAWSGPAVAELLRQFVAHNRMVSGGFIIRDRTVTLAEITSPVLAFVGEADDIGQPIAVRGIVRAAPRADVYESILPTGHFGLVVGSTAGARTWPTTAEWIRWRDGAGDQPAAVVPMAENSDEAVGHSGVSLSSRMTHGLGAVAETGATAGREAIELVNSVRRTSEAVVRESVRTLPRLVRLGQIQPGTRISLGKLMNENAKKAGAEELFLFEDRVLSHTEVNTRIDNVVAGLIDCGVRPGEHVGVLMATRPSALVAIAALSRLGAVCVLLGPNDELPEMIHRGGCSVVMVDPVHVDQIRGLADRVLLLGGGSRDQPQAYGDGIVDMELIDPDAVEIPSWYRPDPGLAADLAFVLFTRVDAHLERWPVTNHRWAMSAFGAASAARLSDNDTVYCLTPLHHAAGLLTTLGATVAGGARIALSSEISAERFASEVYRYGITVVSYTWTMMEDVLDADDLSIGKHNPIRLFMGSGMPRGLWKRVLERFPTANVLEFFATADGSAILANVTGTKVGAMGRPLPETNRVRVAAYDVDAEQYDVDGRGFVREAAVDEVGVLLAQTRQRYEMGGMVLRDVFSRGDRWESSGHLFRRDSDGDFWFLGNVAGIIKSSDGPVYQEPIIAALTEIPVVGRAALYGHGEPGRTLAVAVIAPRGDASPPTVSALRIALAGLPLAERPHLIWFVDEIPISRSYRPLVAEFRRQGLPTPGPRVWYRDENGRYRKYTKTAAAELSWAAPAPMPRGSAQA
ncbi:AMP-binding protein [Williamsia sterculiae]|uniref:Putative long chain acyl-CoA synthase n=1 Tax=Williamsia sterculiae TaxID=1344003 RepID=A0A1N7HGV4_9NOCA|nr:AMP-binding protein [Williamsia sterculiae]SIS23910.1 putative long chain acyl-CoA synthase [Williamsia sterculiae]